MIRQEGGNCRCSCPCAGTQARRNPYLSSRRSCNSTCLFSTLSNCVLSSLLLLPMLLPVSLPALLSLRLCWLEWNWNLFWFIRTMIKTTRNLPPTFRVFMCTYIALTLSVCSCLFAFVIIFGIALNSCAHFYTQEIKWFIFYIRIYIHMYTYLWVKCSEDLKNRNKGQLSCGLNFYTLTKRDTESEAKAEHSDNNNHN